MNEFELEKEYEKLLNIRTSGRDDSKAGLLRFPYEPTPYCVLERLAKSGLIGKKNTLLDLGCGKGRVSFFLSYFTKCRSIGIEYDERLYRAAVSNKERSVSWGRVCFENADAEYYEVPDDVDRVFLFNPFSEEILGKVTKSLLASFSGKQRDILVFSYYPSDVYINLLMSMEELELTEEISCEDLFEGNELRERIIVFRIKSN